MIEHLENVIADIDMLKNENSIILNDINLDDLKTKIIGIKNNLNDIKNIDLDIIKEISDTIYDLNYNNDFSKITDKISNEFYAFSFLIENDLKNMKEGKDYE